MKLSLKFTVSIFALVLFLSAANIVAQQKSFRYESAGNPAVETFMFTPSKINAKTRILMVMSGVGRNAEEYLGSWTNWAEKNNYLIVCPLFDNENWDGSRGYNFGNVFSENNGGGQINPRSKWSFTIVEGIHQKVRKEYKISAEKFDIFGHSAGAQFVHRFMLFADSAKVKTAIAANAGWYTLPDLTISFPYGLKNSLLTLTEKDLIAWTNRPLILMRGTEDLSREGNFRKTAEADKQGKTRYERAGFMFEKVKSFNPQTRWKLIDVPNVGHDQQGIALAAQKILQNLK